MTEPAAPIQLLCYELPAFDARDLDAVRAAFAPAVACELRQHWRPQPEPDFQPAVVRAGWRASDLLVFAEFTDADIFSTATGLNQHMWVLGDVFEIFLRPVTQEAYLEFHVTPNNHRLQLRFPNATAWRSAPTDTFAIAGEAFHSRAWVRPTARQWFVFAQIPAASVCDTAGPLAGTEWLFSFSRYDYTRGRPEPVCSSTSPHPVFSFHSQPEWGRLCFVA